MVPGEPEAQSKVRIAIDAGDHPRIHDAADGYGLLYPNKLREMENPVNTEFPQVDQAGEKP
jgi:hypothetical protein